MDKDASWPPRRSKAERRKMATELLYEFEMEARRQSFLADPALVGHLLSA